MCDPSVDQFLHSEGSGSGESDSDFLLPSYHHHGKYPPPLLPKLPLISIPPHSSIMYHSLPFYISKSSSTRNQVTCCYCRQVLFGPILKIWTIKVGKLSHIYRSVCAHACVFNCVWYLHCTVTRVRSTQGDGCGKSK